MRARARTIQRSSASRWPGNGRHAHDDTRAPAATREGFERVAVEADVDVFTVPAAMLEEITIVDTPGTNAIYREHEAMTRDFHAAF